MDEHAFAGDALRQYRVVWPARPPRQSLASIVATDL